MSLKAESLYLEYLGLGKSRTITKLAELTGQSVDSLYKTGQRHKWKERAELDDKAIQDKYDSKDYSELGASEILSGISRKSLEKLDRVINTVKVNNPRDAKIMLELAQLAAGKPTQITETQDNTDTGDMIHVSILFDILEMLPKEWADFAHAQLDRIIESESGETETEYTYN